MKLKAPCWFPVRVKPLWSPSILHEAIRIDASYKEMARRDEDFKTYWVDPDFIKLTEE